MRVAPAVIRAKADQVEHFRDPLAPLGTGHGSYSQRFSDAVGDTHAWMKRSVRLLEDELQTAAHLAHGGRVQRNNIGAVDLDAARGRLDEPQQATSECGFSTAGLSHEAERPAGFQVEGNVIDGFQLTEGGRSALEIGSGWHDGGGVGAFLPFMFGKAYFVAYCEGLPLAVGGHALAPEEEFAPIRA